MFRISKKSSQVEQKKRLEILISILEQFKFEGRNEVSYIELNKSIQRIQKSLNLGYKYYDKLVYSDLLMKDLDYLDNKLFIKQYRYTYNGFLPKSYVSLTTYGIGVARGVIENLPEYILDNITKAVEKSTEEYEETWKFFARPVRR